MDLISGYVKLNENYAMVQNKTRVCSSSGMRPLLKTAAPEVLSGPRVSLPRPISEEHVSVTPEELRRGGTGRCADKADLVPAGESAAQGVNDHRRCL